MLVIRVSLCCQCPFIKCGVGFVCSVTSLQSFYWPDCRLNQLALDSTFEHEEVQTDESFVPVCLMDVYMIKLSLKTGLGLCVMLSVLVCSVQT